MNQLLTVRTAVHHKMTCRQCGDYSEQPKRYLEPLTFAEQPIL